MMEPKLAFQASVETYALMYNNELISEAPETLEELEQIGEELTIPANDQYGFLLEAQNAFFAYPFLAAYGGYFFGEENGGYDVGDIGLSNQGTVEGTELIRSWYEKGYLPRNLNADIMNGLFLQGNVGAVVSGPWNINDYRNALGDSLETAPLPMIDGERLKSFAGVKGWMVNQYSDHINWAKELALFMTSKESSEIFFEYAQEIPARDDIELENELYDGFVEQLEYAQFMPNIPAVSAVWEPLGDALIFISNGDDAEEVLLETQGMIEDEIEIMGAWR
ncbi:sugar ABC transporter substrate-binding protein [Alkalicoccobacillus plakortidis]|uniref:Maltodextrin-binding protein n=1 Tax=Alkalicoccobacillus plakortidis TaxID=444060 RepID=A0ABT0XQ18_9BACI|nr:extracellular solute-binding protein [Alkalicoccobacillus plakortidis]MCM2678004.1 extracellular solute-binding protein [Alkalicoccobacillus plakortidis]